MWICNRHKTSGESPLGCYQCAAELQTRDILGTLEARIADLGEELAGLRRRVDAQQHQINDVRRAHNRLALEREREQQLADIRAKAQAAHAREAQP